MCRTVCNFSTAKLIFTLSPALRRLSFHSYSTLSLLIASRDSQHNKHYLQTAATCSPKKWLQVRNPRGCFHLILITMERYSWLLFLLPAGLLSLDRCLLGIVEWERRSHDSKTNVTSRNSSLLLESQHWILGHHSKYSGWGMCPSLFA